MAVPVISDVVKGTIDSFLDLALFIASMMIVYYIVKFFLAAPPTKAEREAEEEGRKAKFKGWVDEQKDKAQQRAAHQERKKLLEPAQGWIIKVEEVAEKLRGTVLQKKTEGTLKSAQRQIEGIEDNLKKAKTILRVAGRKEKEERREFLRELFSYVEAMEELTQQQIKGNLPASVADPHWEAKMDVVRTNLNNLKARCGYLIDSIDKFIDERKLEPPGTLPRGR